jgi:hypothetical protein
VDVPGWVEKMCSSSDVAMRDLWRPMLKHSWKQGREEARQVLESITVEVAAQFEECTEKGSQAPVLTPGQKRLLEGIYSTCQDRELDFLGAFSAALMSDFALSQVQPNPTKQSPYEEAVVAFLRARAQAGSRVKAVYKLDSSKLAVRFTPDGKAHVGTSAPAGASKSADIAVLLEVGAEQSWMLLTHKYGRTDGGHQKNQYNDALAFARNAGAGSGAIVELDALDGGAPRPWRAGVLFDGSYFEGRVAAAREALGGECWVGSADQFVDDFGKTAPPEQAELDLG